ncbi:MAG TPA: TIGR03790 family protein [Caldimonas sp.]|jgi:uncharacterized protein (TIGR03790 family)|nr:TIGR03790 family protein [Caldimonas sp.]HEX2540151.1 TIGR03790 family protein [Caldimonas sp.]
MGSRSALRCLCQARSSARASRPARRSARCLASGLASVLAVVLAAAVAPPAAAQRASTAAGPEEQLRLSLPPIGLRSRDVAIVVNDADPASVEVARYYAAKRGIPEERVIHVRFTPGQPVMPFGEYLRVREVLDAKAGHDVQALALAWTYPFRVECMSVTSAFALGFDPGAYCAEGCHMTKAQPYFNSRSTAPFTDLRMRPAMLLAGKDVESVKRMIDRGLRSDESWPDGKAYLLSTRDPHRNVRAASFEHVRTMLGTAYPIERIDADALEGKPDVMFHFTGVAQVAGIASNRFLDGAIADHLTSHGGVLSGAGQTTVLEWLAAGATGSYGASIEPCNFLAKFPDIGVVMGRYLGGESLVEAYWKSVLMPGQGLFVGDPLARPFGGLRATRTAAGTVIETRALPPGPYLLEASRSTIGPFQPVSTVAAMGFGVRRVTLPANDSRYFRLRRLAEPTRPGS